jgi:hypothetical protein
MSTQQFTNRDGTISVVSDSHSPFGEVGGTPSRAEHDFEKERRERRITRSKLRARFRCTDEQFEAILSRPGFPASVGRKINLLTSFGIGEALFDLEQVNSYLAQEHAFVALLPRAIK